MVVIVIIVSFILDSIISNFISLHSLFYPLFTLMSLIIIYPYFNGNHRRYLVTSFLTGMFYDLIYTDTIIVHAFLFLLIGFVVIYFNQILSNNYLNVSIMGAICIIVYRLVSYILYLMTGDIGFNVWYLFEGIYSSLILNIIYVALVYIITDKISIKFKIRKAN